MIVIGKTLKFKASFTTSHWLDPVRSVALRQPAAGNFLITLSSLPSFHGVMIGWKNSYCGTQHFQEVVFLRGGSVATCWTQAQNGPGSNRSRDTVG